MFFMLARSLKLAGMDYHQIKGKLLSEAEFAHTPSEEGRNPGLIEDLREYFSREVWKPRTRAISVPAA